jgi:hypothetical protein
MAVGWWAETFSSRVVRADEPLRGRRPGEWGSGSAYVAARPRFVVWNAIFVVWIGMGALQHWNAFSVVVWALIFGLFVFSCLAYERTRKRAAEMTKAEQLAGVPAPRPAGAGSLDAGQPAHGRHGARP